MLIALLSDIHANRLALDAAIARATDLGAERFAFLGDIVGYGPDPVEVTQRVADLVAKGAFAILGNHDEAAVTGRGNMNSVAAAAIAWTHAQLGASEKAFLKGLPLQVEEDHVLYVHADASKPGDWRYVTDSASAARSMAAVKARVTLCGHVHKPALYHMAGGGKVGHHTPVSGMPMPLSGLRQWLAVCGSVGQPRDGNPSASFALFDMEKNILTCHRASYDFERVAERILAAGLPESLAARLVKGY